MSGRAPSWLNGVGLVDAHHHFWQLGRFPYRWLHPDAPPARFGDKSAIRKDFLPQDYLQALHGLPLRASVHVQANCGAADPAEETRWLQNLSDTTGWPSAAIAEVDLTRDDAIALIERHRRYGLMRGIRTPVAWDRAGRWRVAAQPDVLNDPRFQDCARYLADHALVLECVVVPEQLPAIAQFAAGHAGLTIVINHFATLEPAQPGNAEDWLSGIAGLAHLPNVIVKLSGLWTADQAWSVDVLQPFFDHMHATLGAARMMWGSNMPVESIMCPIGCQFTQLGKLLSGYDAATIACLMGGTAQHVYRL